MFGIIRGEVAVGGSGHDNSKASVFKQLFKSHCNTQVDILFHDAGGGNLTGITSTMPRVNYNNGGISVFAGIFCKSADTSSEVEGQNKES